MTSESLRSTIDSCAPETLGSSSSFAIVSADFKSILTVMAIETKNKILSSAHTFRSPQIPSTDGETQPRVSVLASQLESLDVADHRVEGSGCRRSVSIEDVTHVFAKDEGVPRRVESGGHRGPSVHVSDIMKWTSYETSIKIQLRTSKITNVSAVQTLDGTNHPREPFLMHEFTKDGEEDGSSGCSSKRALGLDNGIEDIYSKDGESSRPSGDIYPIVVGKAQIRRISNLFQGEDTSEHEHYTSVTPTSRNVLPSTQNINSTHRREKCPIPKYLKQSPKYPIFVKFGHVSFPSHQSQFISDKSGESISILIA